MIARRFRRVAVPLVVAAVAFGLTGCENSTSDAATVTYRDGTGSHTIHISRAAYMKELAALVGSSAFQSFLQSNNYSLTGDQESTTGANLSATYLSQLVGQTATDAEFSALELNISTDVRTAAVSQAKQQFPLTSEIGQDAQGNQTFIGTGIVYASFPKWLQNAIVDREARALAVGQYYSSLTTAKEQALYDEFAGIICPSGRRVAHILVKSASTADAILAQLQGGASFADLARTKSTDTTSAKAGGVVGCLSRGTFVKEFENAAYAAPFGVPTGPVKSQFGYHVILVTHPTFADVRDQLAQALQQNAIALTRALRLQLMQVRINPQFGTGALAVDSQQGDLRYRITPPPAPYVRVCREKQYPCSTTTTASTTTVPAGG